MKKRTLSLLLALLMLVSIFPADKTYAVETENEISVWYFNPVAEAKEEAGTVALYRGGDVCLSAILRDDISGDVQWQIEAGQDFWVDIQGGTTEDLRVSFGMVKSLLKDNAVRMRCVLSANDGLFYSKPFTVVVTDEDTRPSVSTFAMERDPIAPGPLPAPTAVANPVEETKPIVTKEAEPAVTEETEPVVTEETEPAATEETEPAVMEETEPAVTEETGSAATEETAIASTVPVQAPQMPSSASAPPVTENSELTNEDVTIHTITIAYVYGESSKFKGQRVALPYIAQVAEGVTLNVTVNSPICVGYTPDRPSVDLSTLDAIKDDHIITVSYSPAEVSYTVRHYQQNINDDEYTLVETTLATGKTEALTSDAAAKTYTGFTALTHYHEEIAANSSTKIDIYYDRNYYLMSFDLDGGYGTEPIYARYGADISINKPYKPGYTFVGWDTAIPATMPAESRTYKAKWEANSSIPFTVAYWLENPNAPGNYDFWTSVQLSAEAGSTVNGDSYADYLDEHNLDEYERRYSEYSHADANVTIKGDGTTVVNVYYNRKEYTLKFYYAMSSGSGTNAKYYVIGGSTYFFGAASKLVDSSDEIGLLNQYFSTDLWAKEPHSQVGQVDELPSLNTEGQSRNYTTGTDTSTVNGVAYNYHYISFKAKYGADTSTLWPCDVFNSVTRKSSNTQNQWSGTEAFVSAWNGEHHVYYSQHNANQTIKGNYNELDHQLLWDFDDYGDSDTVSYLCFWENGADIGWSVPELYRYNIYVPVLDGQNTSGLTTKVYNSVTYYLLETYDTVDDSEVARQTPPAINGFTYEDKYDSSQITDFDKSLYKEAWNVNFYYSRNENTLTFMNGSTPAKKEKVCFKADISGMAPDDLEYHDSSLKDLYVFDGWYTTPDAIPGTKFDLTSATMPDSAVTLYAKWSPITRKVTIYLTEADAKEEINQIWQPIHVTHDTLVPEEFHPDETELENGEDTFIGWFYKDENNVEQAFSFATMTITQDMTIYAKWRSNVMKKVTVRYVIQDENGAQTEIADTETLMLRVGSTRTFEAKTGMSLYEQYRTGCFPTTTSHSITPEAKDLESDDPITWTFVYKLYSSVPYKVEFYVQLEEDADNDGELDLRPAYKDVNGKAEFVSADDYASSSPYTPYVEKHENNDKAVVTELYIPENLQYENWALPDGYVPNALKIQKVIVPGEDNTIQFIYRYAPGETTGLYSVNHYIQNPKDPEQYDLYRFEEDSGTVGNTASASPVSIPGYTYSHDVTDTKKQEGTILAQGTDGAADVMSGTIAANDSLELNFYYTVNSYPYQVMYLEKDTNRVLAPAKTTGVDGKQLTALYGSKVTETAVSIDGYDVDVESKSIFIQQEAANANGTYTANINTITFYYTQKSAGLCIHKEVVMDEEQAKEENIAHLPEEVKQQEFEYEIFSETGFPKNVYDYTITHADGTTTDDKAVAETRTMTVKVKGGESVLIKELPLGDYRVTETYVVGFRASVNGTIAQAHTVTLESKDKTVTLPFVNTYPFYTGDLVIKKDVVKQDESDPDATKPYKVTVTLKPDDAARETDRVITWTDGDNTARTYTVPKLTGDATDEHEFTFDVLVPVGGEVKLVGTPAGTFTVEEKTQGTGYITDFYTVTYNKAVHQNDEVRGTSHVVNGDIHGGHPTAVTFTNTYKKGTLTINKTVTQEYENDDWQSDTFTFSITGTTELPDGKYTVANAMVTVENGVATVKDANGNDPTITITKTTDTTSWNGSLSFADLPAGYYTVEEASSIGDLENYTVNPESRKCENLLVNSKTPTVAAFTNTYKRHHADLTIETTCADSNQSFIFEVRATDSNVCLQVVLVGSNSKTIKDLPVGTYTVTEQNPWSWREAEVNSQEVSLTTEDKTVSFDFGVVDRIHWLSGYSHNQCKKGGS